MIPHQRPGLWGIDRESCEFTEFPTRGQAGGVLIGNQVNLQDSLIRCHAGEVSAANHVKFTGFPDKRQGWWAISRESCKFTEFSNRGLAV